MSGIDTEAGPSRVRLSSSTSPSSSAAHSPTTEAEGAFRDSVDDGNRYRYHSGPGGALDDDDDEDDLPGYTAPSMAQGQGAGIGDADKGPQARRESIPDPPRGGNGSEPLLGGRRSREGFGAVDGDMHGGGGSSGYGHGRSVGGSASVHGLESSSASVVSHRRAKWWRETFITGCFVASWYGFATLLSLYNKWMFSEQYYNFPFPLFVTTCHMVVQFVLALGIRLVWPKRFRPVERPMRKDYVLKIFPTAASTAGDIGLSNLSLRTITLSLYTMCKSSALIFVLLFAFLFRLESFSLRLIGVISLISFGVFLMVFDTTAVNVPGIIMVFTASALSGLRWALTETLMKKQHMGLSNPFATIFWLAPLMALVLAPVSAGVEGWAKVFGNGHFDGGQAIWTVLVIVFPGSLAFAMVASEYFIIDRAGILPLSIAGVFKEVSTISIAAWVFGDQLTRLNVVGVVIAVCGIALFAFHKYQRSMSEPDPHGHGHGRSAESSHGTHDASRAYALASSSDPDAGGISHTYPPGSPSPPLALLPDEAGVGVGPSAAARVRTPGKSARVEDAEERTERLRDEFEGWGEDTRDGDDWGSGSEGESASELADEEVGKRRAERLASGEMHGPPEGAGGMWMRRGRWKRWWNAEM